MNNTQNINIDVQKVLHNNLEAFDYNQKPLVGHDYKVEEKISNNSYWNIDLNKIAK